MSGDHNDSAKSLRQIIELGVPGLRAEIAAAGAEHRVLPANVTEGTAADVAIELERQSRKVAHIVGKAAGESQSQASSRGLQPFARGMVCTHKKSGKKVTILQASVDVAPSGAPVHKVVFSNGNTKNVPEGNLERF